MYSQLAAFEGLRQFNTVTYSLSVSLPTTSLHQVSKCHISVDFMLLAQHKKRKTYLKQHQVARGGCEVPICRWLFLRVIGVWGMFLFPKPEYYCDNLNTYRCGESRLRTCARRGANAHLRRHWNRMHRNCGCHRERSSTCITTCDKQRRNLVCVGGYPAQVHNGCGTRCEGEKICCQVGDARARCRNVQHASG